LGVVIWHVCMWRGWCAGHVREKVRQVLKIILLHTLICFFWGGLWFTLHESHYPTKSMREKSC